MDCTKYITCKHVPEPYLFMAGLQAKHQHWYKLQGSRKGALEPAGHRGSLARMRLEQLLLAEGQCLQARRQRGFAPELIEALAES